MSFIAPAGPMGKGWLVVTSLIKTKFRCQSQSQVRPGHGTDRGGRVVCIAINSLVRPDTGREPDCSTWSLLQDKCHFIHTSVSLIPKRRCINTIFCQIKMNIQIKMISFHLNKHCEILVSCSDKEGNCMQAHDPAFKLMQLHASICNCMQAYLTACKLIYLHTNLCNCMQAYVTACKLM